jgi:hypothetical protein
MYDVEHGERKEYWVKRNALRGASAPSLFGARHFKIYFWNNLQPL